MPHTDPVPPGLFAFNLARPPCLRYHLIVRCKRGSRLVVGGWYLVGIKGNSGGEESTASVWELFSSGVLHHFRRYLKVQKPQLSFTLPLLLLTNFNKIINGPWGCLFLVPSKVFHCWKGLSMSWVLAHLNPFRKQFPASRGELSSRGRSLGIKGELFCNSLARSLPLLLMRSG